METKDTAAEPVTLTVRETAMLLGIGRNQAYEAVMSGNIPAIKIGDRWLVLRGPLKRMLDGGTDARSAI